MAEIISMSLQKELLEELEKIQKENKYSNRSELIRDSLRALIAENHTLEKMIGHIFGTLLITFNREYESNVNELLHENENLISLQLHRKIGSSCLHILMVEGKAKQIVKLINSIKKIKGVKQVKISII